MQQDMPRTWVTAEHRRAAIARVREQPDADLLLEILGLDEYVEDRPGCPTCGEPIPISGQGRCRKSMCKKARGRKG